MKIHLAIAVISMLLLMQAGCATRPQIQMKTPFSIKDFEPYKAKGTGRIYGQAFLKTRGGDVKLAAGNTVQLWPFSPFMKEAISLKEQGYQITNYTQEKWFSKCSLMYGRALVMPLGTLILLNSLPVTTFLKSVLHGRLGI